MQFYVKITCAPPSFLLDFQLFEKHLWYLYKSFTFMVKVVVFFLNSNIWDFKICYFRTKCWIYRKENCNYTTKCICFLFVTLQKKSDLSKNVSIYSKDLNFCEIWDFIEKVDFFLFFEDRFQELVGKQLIEKVKGADNHVTMVMMWSRIKYNLTPLFYRLLISKMLFFLSFFSSAIHRLPFQNRFSQLQMISSVCLVWSILLEGKDSQDTSRAHFVSLEHLFFRSSALYLILSEALELLFEVPYLENIIYDMAVHLKVPLTSKERTPAFSPFNNKYDLSLSSASKLFLLL